MTFKNTELRSNSEAKLLEHQMEEIREYFGHITARISSSEEAVQIKHILKQLVRAKDNTTNFSDPDLVEVFRAIHSFAYGIVTQTAVHKEKPVLNEEEILSGVRNSLIALEHLKQT